MNLHASYKRIALALMPNYPTVSATVKLKIANGVAIFIPKQLALQPYYILYPLRILVLFMAISIRISGPSAILFWRKIPAGNNIERLFRSLVTIKFFENDEVLASLGEKTGKERVEDYRAKWNA